MTEAFVNFVAVESETVNSNDDEEHDAPEQTTVDHFSRHRDFRAKYLEQIAKADLFIALLRRVCSAFSTHTSVLTANVKNT